MLAVLAAVTARKLNNCCNLQVNKNDDEGGDNTSADGANDGGLVGFAVAPGKRGRDSDLSIHFSVTFFSNNTKKL